jgi:hypothetical protein
LDKEEEFQEYASNIIDELVNKGIAELDGIDKDGDFIYKFDMQLMKELMPDFYGTWMEEIEENLISLYQKGLVEIEYDENLEAVFNISEEAKEALKDFGLVIGDEDE